jgi:deazaflavin-dependent oxidoreductase (nitroreductase family)
MAVTGKPYTKTEMAIANPIIKAMSKLNTWAYRASGGRVGGKFLRGAPVMLLTTVGRKSGQRRTAPLLYLKDGEDVICVASKGGMPNHPLWYRNLEANPNVEVQIGNELTPMRATVANDAQKATYWPKLTAMYRDFNDYQARTERNIPVVILSPR